MSLNIVNEDFSMTVTPLGAWIPGTPSYTVTKASKAEENNKKILLNIISWSMSGCILAGSAFVSGAGSVSATALKCKCDSLSVMREQDSGTCNGTFQPSGAPPPPPVPCSCTFIISNAGQNKVKGL